MPGSAHSFSCSGGNTSVVAIVIHPFTYLSFVMAFAFAASANATCLSVPMLRHELLLAL